MKRRVTSAMRLVAACFIVGTVGAQAPPTEQIRAYLDHLTCGGSIAELKTDCIENPGGGWECVSQSLRMRNGSGGRGRAVQLDSGYVDLPGVAGLRVLDGYVTDWACVQSRSGRKFLLLGYSCRGLGNNCASRGLSPEWEQIVSVDGKVVIGGRDRVDAAMERRLGLDKLLRQGVPAIHVGPAAQTSR